MWESIMEYKWLILILSETISWIGTFYAAYARYWINSSIHFKIAGLIILIVDYIPQTILAVFNYLEKSKIDIFTFSTILLLILVLIFGKKIDNKLKEYVTKQKEKGIKNLYQLIYKK